MISPRHENEIRADIAAILAAEAGVDRSNRVYGIYVTKAFGLMQAVAHRSPADPSGRVDELLSEYHANFQHRLAARQARAEAGAARTAAQKSQRDRPEGFAEGFVRLTMRDEATGIAYAIDLLEAQVRQIGR